MYLQSKVAALGRCPESPGNPCKVEEHCALRSPSPSQSQESKLPTCKLLSSSSASSPQGLCGHASIDSNINNMRSRAVVAAAAATTTTTTISYTGGSRRTIKAATTDDSLVISKTLSLQHQAKSQNPHGQLFFWSGAYSLLISAELGGCNFFSSRNLRMDWRPRVKVMNLEPMVAVEVSMEFVEMPPASINNWSGGFLFATNPTHTHERDPAAACSCKSGMVSTATSMSFSVPSPPSSTFSSSENFLAQTFHSVFKHANRYVIGENT